MCRPLVLFTLIALGNFFIPPAVEAILEKYLDPAVSPCDDFYQYTCGRWEDLNYEKLNADTLSYIETSVYEKITTHLDSKKTQGVFPKLRTLYESCRQLSYYDTNAYLDALSPQGGWAIWNIWDKTKFNWLQTVAEFRRYGPQIVFELTVMPKWENSSVPIIYLDLANLRPTVEYLIKDLLQDFSIDYSMADEIVAFEKQLAAIKDKAKPEDTESEEVVLGYLIEALPQIDWKKYINLVFEEEVDLYTPIIVQDLEAMTLVAEFLDSSDSRAVCNYIMIKYLQFIDKTTITSPVDRCSMNCHQAMPLAMDNFIEHNFYDHEFDQLTQDFFNYLKVEFLAEVSKLYEDQRDVLLFIYTKASVMELQIGNSQRNLTDEAIAKYYEPLQVEEGQFYKSFLEALKFKTTKDFKSLKGEPVHIGYQWFVSPSPFFMHPWNKIIIPYTLLQDRIFGEDLAANKYSVLGFIIGHELLHGFDTNGVRYDYTGSMVQNALACNSSFSERVKCVREQMGSTGIGEKIADLGGVGLAYNAYQRSLTQVGKNMTEKVKGKDWTVEQAFFIDFAQFFCGRKRGQSTTDIHETDDLRVLRTLQNFNGFAKAFSCPVGSGMNPEKKCTVW